jgi:hypothetical protein
MAQQTITPQTILAQGAGFKGQAIGWNCQVAGANVGIMGIADHHFVAGDAVRVLVGHVVDALSGGAIDGTESRLMTNASGKLIPWTTGNVVAARLIVKPGNIATGADQFIEVSPIRS